MSVGRASPGRVGTKRSGGRRTACHLCLEPYPAAASREAPARVAILVDLRPFSRQSIKVKTKSRGSRENSTRDISSFATALANHGRWSSSTMGRKNREAGLGRIGRRRFVMANGTRPYCGSRRSRQLCLVVRYLPTSLTQGPCWRGLFIDRSSGSIAILTSPREARYLRFRYLLNHQIGSAPIQCTVDIQFKSRFKERNYSIYFTSMAREPISSLDGQKVPVLLLKTKSSPTDAYEDLFSTPHHNLHFEPIFVPVLQHRFEEDGLQSLRELLHARKINSGEDSAYGGLIFTSQRAVDAFAQVVDEGQGPSPSTYTSPSYQGS